MNSAVIVDLVRTASGKGKPGGALSGVHPVTLLADTLTALLDRTGIDPASVDDVIAGCVSQAGEQTLNIARNAVLDVPGAWDALARLAAASPPAEHPLHERGDGGHGVFAALESGEHLPSASFGGAAPGSGRCE